MSLPHTHRIFQVPVILLLRLQVSEQHSLSPLHSAQLSLVSGLFVLYGALVFGALCVELKLEFGGGFATDVGEGVFRAGGDLGVEGVLQV